jgi:hypothetical protein
MQPLERLRSAGRAHSTLPGQALVLGRQIDWSIDRPRSTVLMLSPGPAPPGWAMASASAEALGMVLAEALGMASAEA